MMKMEESQGPNRWWQAYWLCYSQGYQRRMISLWSGHDIQQINQQERLFSSPGGMRHSKPSTRETRGSPCQLLVGQ